MKSSEEKLSFPQKQQRTNRIINFLKEFFQNH
jgi:hypothetical protein